MPIWILSCPNCGTRNEIASDQVLIDCGSVSCVCDCIQCGEQIDGQQDYWRWLGLKEGPQPTSESPRTT